MRCSPNRFFSQESDEWSSLSSAVKLENSVMLSLHKRINLINDVDSDFYRRSMWILVLMKRFKDSNSKLIETVVDCNRQPKLSHEWLSADVIFRPIVSFMYLLLPSFKIAELTLDSRFERIYHYTQLSYFVRLPAPSGLRVSWETLENANQRHWDHW